LFLLLGTQKKKERTAEEAFFVSPEFPDKQKMPAQGHTPYRHLGAILPITT